MRYCGIFALPCAVLRYLYPLYAPLYYDQTLKSEEERDGPTEYRFTKKKQKKKEKRKKNRKLDMQQH